MKWFKSLFERGPKEEICEIDDEAPTIAPPRPRHQRPAGSDAVKKIFPVDTEDADAETAATVRRFIVHDPDTPVNRDPEPVIKVKPSKPVVERRQDIRCSAPGAAGPCVYWNDDASDICAFKDDCRRDPRGVICPFRRLPPGAKPSRQEPSFSGLRDPDPRLEQYRRDYLKLREKLPLADRLYGVPVVILGEKGAVVVVLKGWMGSNELLDVLRESGPLTGPGPCRVQGWPHADPAAAGPAYHHIPAAVCELPDAVFIVEKREFMEVLYGCPSALGPAVKAPVKETALIDY